MWTLRWGMWDLEIPDQRLNPGPFHWEHGFLVTVPQGKSPVHFLKFFYFKIIVDAQEVAKVKSSIVFRNFNDLRNYSTTATVLCLVSHVQLFGTLWTVAHQAPLFMGILQERILEWVAMPSSRGSSQARNQTRVSCIVGGFFTSCTTREAPQQLISISISSVAQSCPTLCDPMNHSTPGLPVHHQLPEFTQTQVHRVGDAIQPSHPLSSPSLPAPNPSQHQGLFQWVNSSHEVAKVLEFQLQHQSFQRTPRTDLL